MLCMESVTQSLVTVAHTLNALQCFWCDRLIQIETIAVTSHVNYFHAQKFLWTS